MNNERMNNERMNNEGMNNEGMNNENNKNKNMYNVNYHCFDDFRMADKIRIISWHCSESDSKSGPDRYSES
jgi:hypothetical protein